MGHLDEYVDAVNEWPADAPLVPGDQAGRAGTMPERVAVIAAGTRVHGTHQHEVSREGDPALGTSYAISNITR